MRNAQTPALRIDCLHLTAGKDVFDHPLRSSLGRRPQAPDAAREAGLRVDQELGGSHHMVTFLDTGDNFDPVATLHAGHHLVHVKAAFSEGDNHPVAARRPDQCFARDAERAGLQRPEDADLGIHVWFQPPFGVIETQPYAQGAGLRVQHRVDVIHLPGEYLPRNVIQPGFGRLPDRHPFSLRLEHLGLQPHTGQICQAHDRRVGLHIHSFANVERGHHTVLGRLYANVLAHFSAGGQGFDVSPHHAQGTQFLLTALPQALVAALQGLQELFLGIQQFRRIQLEQQVPCSHPFAFGFHRQPLDPALGPQVDVADSRLVETDVAGCLDLAPHGPNGGHLGAHSQVVFHRGADSHGSRRVICATIPAFGIDGHQIHAHWRLAGLVAPKIRIHRRHPVQNFRLGRRRPGSSGCRRAGFTAKATAGEIADSQCDRQGQGQNQFVSHPRSPPR